MTVEAPGWPAALPTRVEDLDDEVVIAAPVGEHDALAPDLGVPIRVRWSSDRGPISMDAMLVAKELRGVPTWRLQPDGPVVITQRRLHARAGALVPVVLRSYRGRLDGLALDLSEGGMRSVHRSGVAPEPGDAAMVELELDDRSLVLAAEVTRVESHQGRRHVVCRFTGVDDGDADRIRRYVFARQAREQRLR
ncbi:MAG TPA: PilZ domain-containing protein [Acidimicrobiales bacterium]|nr:PilZ domain-containing protein [Acidimicrobiales bacterium]